MKRYYLGVDYATAGCPTVLFPCQQGEGKEPWFNGEWVRYSAVAAIKKERDRWKREAMAARPYLETQPMGDGFICYPVPGTKGPQHAEYAAARAANKEPA